MTDGLFLPDGTESRGGRSIKLSVTAPEITEADETRATVKIEGLAVDENNGGAGAVIELSLMGNQIKIPRAIGFIKIIIEE
ncbi:MAG: hypothetical protein LBL66_04895 [Clostridiales bacterium]|jgi:hypothetical protein|nr:hypothetical protein [Clostridiales bacterium]